MLHPWYTNDAAMRGTAGRNTKLLRALIEKGQYHGYFLEMEKIWRICVEGKEEEEAKSDFEAKGTKVRFTTGHQYLGELYGGREEMEQWIRHKVQEWAETI